MKKYLTKNGYYEIEEIWDGDWITHIQEENENEEKGTK